MLPHGVDSVTKSEVVWLDDLTERALLELLQGPADLLPEWGGWFRAYFNGHNRVAALAGNHRKHGAKLMEIATWAGA